jgi:large subunit ribosomal protein L3
MMKAALLGKKIGMTSLFTEDGTQVPCTVVEAGPCPVVLLRNKERDGYEAVQIGFDNLPDRKVNKPLKGHFDKAGVNPTRHLKEFRDPEKEYQIGDAITVEEFESGDKVRITGKSKGKGFQGVIKRHGFAGVGMRTHGQKDRQRHPGSIGMSSWPSRVLKGTRMGGRTGGDKVTVRNIEVVDVIPDRNLILLKGSLPGARNSLVEIVK